MNQLIQEVSATLLLDMIFGVPPLTSLLPHISLKYILYL